MEYSFFVLLISLLLLDFIWLGFVTTDGYLKTVVAIQGSPLVLDKISAFLVYPLMALALYVFVITNKSIKTGDKWKYGALLGFVIYGVFNGTNKAIFKKWGTEIAIKDTIWGAVVFGVATYLTMALLGSK